MTGTRIFGQIALILLISSTNAIREHCAEYFDCDMPGNDYMKIIDEPYTHCCDICEVFPPSSCDAWVWTNSTESGVEGICYLKTKKTVHQPKASNLHYVCGRRNEQTTTTSTTSTTTSSTSTTTSTSSTSSTSSTTTTPGPCDRYIDQGIYGYDGTHTLDVHEIDCCQACLDYLPCVAYTWSKATGDNSVWPRGACYLKDVIAPLMGQEGNITGIVKRDGTTASINGTTPDISDVGPSSSEGTSSEENDCPKETTPAENAGDNAAEEDANNNNNNPVATTKAADGGIGNNIPTTKATTTAKAAMPMPIQTTKKPVVVPATTAKVVDQGQATTVQSGAGSCYIGMTAVQVALQMTFVATLYRVFR